MHQFRIDEVSYVNAASRHQFHLHFISFLSRCNINHVSVPFERVQSISHTNYSMVRKLICAHNFAKAWNKSDTSDLQHIECKEHMVLYMLSWWLLRKYRGFAWRSWTVLMTKNKIELGQKYRKRRCKQCHYIHIVREI